MAESGGEIAVGVLGPLEVSVDGMRVELSQGRLRTVLAVLAMSAGKIVSVDRLATAMWDEDLPENARRSVQTHLGRLRSVLGADLIVTAPAGYLLHVDPDRVDALRFVGVLDAAARTADPAARRALLTEALALRRGAPFEGISSNWLRRSELPRLHERYLSAVEQRIDIDLSDQRYGELAAELYELTARYPLRESLWVRLLLVLERGGRQAEALERYEMIRARLADELGADPGPELQEVYASLLAGTPLRLESTATVAAASPAVPQQLPAAVDGFIGRAAALKTLSGLVDDEASRSAGAVVISAIGGTAGVGKTALAVHWAHQVADRFPDGQLYVNLRGFHPSGQVVEPAEAVRGFLDALGVAPQRIPSDPDAQAGLYRTQLAGKQILIVLDNARDAEQVRPLLPGSPGCLVIVTSRNQLTSLIATEAAHPLILDLLPVDEARELLARRLGADRIAAEPQATDDIITGCARLPLALAIAAARAATRPNFALETVARELRDSRAGLDPFTDSDPSTDVRAVFSWSYRALTCDAATTFRLLGLHPGPDIDRYAVAALADTSLEDAHRRVEVLVRAHLVQLTGPGRYGMHDLLRVYAAELTHTRDTEQIRRAAQGRLWNHCRYTASVAMDTAYPYERERRPRIPPTETPTPDLSDPNQAVGWLDIEHPNLLAAAWHAADHGWPAHTVDLSVILRRHLRTRGRYSDAEALHHLALTTAHTIGDRTGELNALTSLGYIHLAQGRHERAADHYQQALQIARILGDRNGELDALHGLGWVHRRQGRHEPAADHYQQAWEIARAIGDRSGELNALNGLANIHWLQGRHEQAIDHYQQAWEIARATGDRSGELAARDGLANMHRLQGRHEQAADHYQQAWEIARTIGHRTGELAARDGLANIHRLQGRHEQASDHYRKILDLAGEIGNRNWQFEALHGLGRLHHTAGSPDAALAHHRQALELATELVQPADQARAHDGLAHAHHALNQPEQARRHWQQALDILTSLGTDHTDDPETYTTAIRAHLAALANR